jgi:hypothetical protein
MGTKYGGSQRVVHSSLMMDKGCLGTHDPQLKVGDTQEMVFSETDDGPFYIMPENERQKLKEGDLENWKFVTINKMKLLK